MPISQYYVLVAVFVFGTALQPFLGDDNRNFLLIGFMALSPALVLPRRISWDHLILCLFMMSVTLFPAIMHPEHVRWSTIFFTLMFTITFIAYENVLRASKIGIERFTMAVRVLLLAHVAVFLAQQVGVLTGLPIVNANNYSGASPWKLNALSAEASHAARIITVLMFAYLSLREISTGERYSFQKQFRKDWCVWLGYLWMVLTMQSGTALIFAPFVILKIADRKNFVYASAALGLAALWLTFYSSEVFERVHSIIQATATFDYRLMLAADHSGALRIAPLFVLAEKIELFSWQGMFGHGIDTVSLFMSDYIYGIPDGSTGGGMLHVWYEYGFVSFALFIVFSMRIASAQRSIVNFLLWVLIVVLSGPNNQIVWMYLAIVTSVEYFREKACLGARICPGV